MIGLQITRKTNTAPYRSRTPISEPPKLLMLNEQQGHWHIDEQGNPVYQLVAAGGLDDTITVLIAMPYNMHITEPDGLTYIASGSRGELNVLPMEEPNEFATRNVLVESKS